MVMTRFKVVQVGSKRMKRPTLYGVNEINPDAERLIDRYEFVGTFDECRIFEIRIRARF